MLVIKAYYEVPETEKGNKLKSYATKVTKTFISIVKRLGQLYDWDELDEPRDKSLVAIRIKYACLPPSCSVVADCPRQPCQQCVRQWYVWSEERQRMADIREESEHH